MFIEPIAPESAEGLTEEIYEKAREEAGFLPEFVQTFSHHPEAYESWKAHLLRRNVKILHEAEWPDALSFYFEDSEGNLLEIANGDLWPR